MPIPELPESIADLKMQRSAQHLADHFADVPLLLFGFAEGDGVRRLDLPGRSGARSSPPGPKASARH